MKKWLFGLLLAGLVAALPAEGAGSRPRSAARMSEREFAILYRHVKEKSFPEERFELIEIGSLDSRFGCDQCRQLLELFSFDDDRLKALAFLAPHITDRRNASQLLELFTFPSNREQAMKLLLEE